MERQSIVEDVQDGFPGKCGEAWGSLDLDIAPEI